MPRTSPAPRTDRSRDDRIFAVYEKHDVKIVVECDGVPAGLRLARCKGETRKRSDKKADAVA